MPQNKISKIQMREIEKKVGQDLVKKHGKKKYYSPKQVEDSCLAVNIVDAFSCWALCFYTDHEAFDAHHQAIGETCDYIGMKQQMVSALTEGASDSWLDFDFDLSWLDIPDFDFSDFFDFFD